MAFPIEPTVPPMLAKSAATLPEGGYLYEPKWDGFRSIVFCDGDDVELQSRSEKSLTRYFPELLEPLRAALPDRCVVDGEIVIATPTGRLDFDLLSQRVHPAASRVAKLSGETPAAFVVFDLLAEGDRDLRGEVLAERHVRLRAVMGDGVPPFVRLTPASTDPAVAHDWFTRFEGAGLDGVIAKPVDGVYESGVRKWWKVKHARTADCVVAGYREHKDGLGVGSLMLGLYAVDGRLQHVGVASSFTAVRRAELRAELAPLVATDLSGHPWAEWGDTEAHAGQRLPGAQSRWTGKRTLDWVPLRPERVAEVRYEHMQGDRFRHTARFDRWRQDRDPRSCTYEQLDVVVPAELKSLFTRET